MGLTNQQAVSLFAAGEKTVGTGNLYASGGTLYSYGRHFPLARPTTDKYSKRAGVRFLINADNYSVTTARHQRLAIDALPDAVQVPNRALFAARLDFDSVQVVDFTAEERWYECPETGDRLREHWDADRLEYLYFYTSGHLAGLFWNPENAKRPRWRHRATETVLRDPETGNHWLAGWDHNEAQHFFICRLPRRAPTVADAYDSLKPKTVRDAENAGLKVLRQGDVFLIPTERETRSLPGPSARMAPVFKGSTHVATEVRTEKGETFVRGTVRHRPGAFRDPEHRMLTLAPGVWYRPVRCRAVEGTSFSIVGNVD